MITEVKFTPRQLKDLLIRMMENKIKQGERIARESVVIPQSNSSTGQTIEYFVLEKNNKKIAVIPDVTKDAGTLYNQYSAVYIGDLIKLLANKPYTLLIPMHQCRGYFKIPIYYPYAQKHHVVTVEIDLVHKRIRVHDPKKNFNKFLREIFDRVSLPIYPDKMTEIVEELKAEGHTFDYKKMFYNAQNDNVLCGAFAHQYIKSYVEQGSAFNFARIKICLKENATHCPKNTILVKDKASYLDFYSREEGALSPADHAGSIYMTEDLSPDEFYEIESEKQIKSPSLQRANSLGVYSPKSGEDPVRFFSSGLQKSKSYNDLNSALTDASPRKKRL